MTGLNVAETGGKSGFRARPYAELASASKAAAERRKALKESGALFSLKGENGQDLSMEEISGGTNGLGQAVSFGYTKRRNEHGYFVGCRIVRKRNGDVRRDQWTVGRKKSAVHARCRARAASFEEKASSDRRMAA